MKKTFSFLFVFIFLLTWSLYSQEKVISLGEEWSYYDKGELSSTWYVQKEFKDWPKGPAPIGYGDRQIVTSVSYGKDPENKDLVKYFSKTFTLNNPEKNLAYVLNIIRDDGIVVYLNGKEIFRNNLPNGKLSFKTRAINVVELEKEEEFVKKVIDSDEFLDGKNTISVAVHQIKGSSSDCIFDLNLIGYNDPILLKKILEDKEMLNYQLESEIAKLNTDLVLDRVSLKLTMEKNKNEDLRFTIYIIFFLFLISLSGFVFSFLEMRKKEKEALNIVDEKNKILLEKEQELLTLSTQLLHNKQYFKEIKADLKALKSNNTQLLTDINYNINLALEGEDEWKVLSKHFNAVFEGFYEKLITLHPDLTEVELRHCMFIKLHMSTKEISNIMLIDPRSVQTARYRIKKKMELDEDVDLRTYLLNL